MDWTEIIVKIASRDVETAAAIATMTVPYGIYIEDYADMDETLPAIGWVDAVDEELLARDRETAAIHLYIPVNQNPGEAAAFIEARLTASDIVYEVTAQTVREEDWADNWKKYYRPLRIGKRLVIRPSWEPYEARPGEVVVDLDPGAAFGTGSHETTRLCLELLEEAITPGDRLLDMGCGSGILSIAALRLGAQSAVAVDIDLNAAATAARNAAENGFGPEVYTALAGDALHDIQLFERIGGEYDVIAANIVADVILPMKELFYGKLRPGGLLVASGLIETRTDEVLDALTAAGFIAKTQRVLDGWVSVLFAKL